MIIYIRHGPDERADHKYDEILTRAGKEEVISFTKQLLEEHGIPDIIYCSPFQRTRQTTQLMIKAIKRYRKENNLTKRVDFIIEPKLGRFFTKQQMRYPDIKESTLRKGAIIKETYSEFKDRVTYHHQGLDPNLHIWNITHTLVLLHISKINRVERSKYVRYLDTVKI